VQKICGRVAIIKEGRIIKLQKISELQGGSYKKYHVETRESGALNRELFPDEGLTDFQMRDNTVDFIFNGDVNLIIARLSQMELCDLVIEEPTLEEIFLHYYR
jgi:ABC-2 type transport system ATP-binding protein